MQRILFSLIILALASGGAAACLDAGSGATGAPNHPPGADTPGELPGETPASEMSFAPRPAQQAMLPPEEPPPAECLAAGNQCVANDECCSGACTLSCNFAYGVGTCIRPRPDGQPCDGDIMCTSAQCVDGVCSSAAVCLPDSDPCMGDDECCSGICAWNGYVGGRCIPPQVDGAFCTHDDWCLTGTCTDGTCGEPACDAAGAFGCLTNGDCCSGICTYQAGQYGPGQCLGPQADGAWCAEDSWCASGHCVGGACSDAACQAAGSECFWHDVCCGFCSYSSQNVYIPGSCNAKLGAGGDCLEDAWCASDSCVDGACK